MLISKQQLACHVCGYADERNALQSICFDEHGAVSTDGKRILIVPYPVNASEDLFETEEAKADAKFKLPPGQSILVHNEQAKQIAAAFFKGDGCIPGVRFAAMEQKGNGEKLISMVNPEQNIRKDFLLDAALDSYPEYRQVIPRSTPTLEVSFSLSLLLDLLTQIKKAQGDDSARFIRFIFRGERGIVELILGEDAAAVRGYIAPARARTNKMQLRPYQRDCLDEIERRGAGRWLCQLATGMGKTVIFSRLRRRGRMLILSHREELVRQPLKYFDCETAIEMASERGGDAEVVSASVQTMSRRLTSYTPDAFDTIVVDEAHHAATETYRKILAHFRPRRVLGFTATPNRADGVGLESAFDAIIFERNLRWGIEQGFLSPIHCRRLNIGYDLSRVSTRMGDYAPGELERAVNVDGCNSAIAEAVTNIAEIPVLIFAVDVAHAEAIAAKIPGAKALSAKSKDRAEVVKAYKDGRVPVLVNCALFTEGTDLPNTRTVLIARPTKSAALYTQMVGRGTRLAEGKPHCLLIDCVGVSNTPLCTAPTLLGLDLESVPARYAAEIEGALLADIPALIEQKTDTPESWINNVKIVDLWAKANSYVLHDVNWIKLPDGGLRLRLPHPTESRAVTLEVSAPDLRGAATFSTSGGYAETLPAQKCYDLAYECLRTRFASVRPLWSLASAKRWGGDFANGKQKYLIRILAKAKGLNVSYMLPAITKLQASQLIERLKG